MIARPIAHLRRHPIALFLGAILLFFALAPFIEMLPNGRHLEALLATLIVCSSIPAARGGRRTITATAILVAPILFGFWFQLHRSEGAAFRWFNLAYMVFLAFIVGRLLTFIVFAPRVTSEVLCAGIAVYLLLGLWWASAYALIDRLMPDAFVGANSTAPRLYGFEGLYFSMITLTTVGFGDIIPVAPPARMLAMMEAATGSLYLTVLIARLVSLHAATAGPGNASRS